MTPNAAARPEITVEEFEEIARVSPETVRLEFLNGKIEVKAVPDGNHGEIVMWLLEQCMRHRPELRLYGERGLKIEAYRNGRARPDGTLAPHRHFMGTGEWVEPDGVLMVVEVTSRDTDTGQRDRVEKPGGYAAAGIPVYLLIDRDAASVVVFAEPEDGRYRSVTSRAYGMAIDLPRPVGFTLETAELNQFVDWGLAAARRPRARQVRRVLVPAVRKPVQKNFGGRVDPAGARSTQGVRAGRGPARPGADEVIAAVRRAVAGWERLMPRFMSLIRVDESTAPPEGPSEALLERMDALIKEMTKAGVMLDTAGLTPAAQGARVHWEGGRLSVTDGPFTESKELVGGYAIVQAKDRAEAIEWTKRFVQVHEDYYTLTCEVREIVEG